MTQYQTALVHLVRMARMPAAVGQARYRARELAATDLFAGMVEALERAMKHERTGTARD